MPANTTNFKVKGNDLNNTFLGTGDFNYAAKYLTDAGLIKYDLAKSLWSWGSNYYGQLGVGTDDTITRSSPTQVAGASTDWKQFSPGFYHCGAIKNDGTLWMWGYNANRQLGFSGAPTVPTKLGTLTNWKLVELGWYYSMAIKTDGTLWSWGLNSNGSLGLGDTTTRTTPTQVGTLTDWNLISNGHNGHTLAIKTDGTLWVWGWNSSGQLGLNHVDNVLSPVQLGSATDWKFVNCTQMASYAIKTDGTLWAWGNNNEGDLGQGDIIHRSSPTQIGSLTDWKTVEGYNQHSIALKTDGTLWGWGRNANYEMGINHNTSPQMSPIQIGALTNWLSISCTADSSFAIKADGTLWAWGANSSYCLGLEAGGPRSSPTQVGTLNTWRWVIGGSYYTYAFQYYG
jgi:alpha-tubulin suppressor-like RCC1 family protein